VPDDKLPEEFAPTGPKLTRFSIRPGPPQRPHLFPDERRFALSLAVLAAGGEFAVWLGVARLAGPESVAAFILGRLLKPAWAKLGTRAARPLVAAALVAAGFACVAVAGHVQVDRVGGRFGGLVAAFLALGFAAPAVGDLCATCIADSVTVERRASAYAWLDMGQALGAVAAVALVSARLIVVGVALLPALALASVPGAFALHDRGTPRSSWPLRDYVSAVRTPLGAQLAGIALLTGLFCFYRAAHREPPSIRTLIGIALPLAGMALASRLEAYVPNAIALPRLIALIAGLGAVLGWPGLQSFALGAMFAALPAAVARGAGEMERPLVSSVAWSALTAGAALAAVLRF
jgi:hypothetical protein